MAHSDALIAEDIDAYLEAQQHKGLLRFITCGSVDDGKSTLIGRMLYEAHLVFDDHLSALTADSKRVGTQGDDIDLALLTDGLQAEREQGITIDVAYRYFSTERRKFIVADTPGHEQYTRNMVTGASSADLAVILIDARKGVLTQTRRHSYLVSLLGIKSVVLAVNKMDLVDYDQNVFNEIVADYSSFAAPLGFDTIAALPMSALRGANIVERGDHLSWFTGPTLFEHLEQVEITTENSAAPFRFAVQWVNRPNLDFRGFSGTVASGSIATGDTVEVAGSSQRSTIERIVTMDGDLHSAIAGQAVTITLNDEIDISRGDLLTESKHPAQVATHLDVHLVWMHEDAMIPGRRYLIKAGTRTVSGVFDPPRYRVDVNTLDQRQTSGAGLNDIVRGGLRLERSIAFDPYEVNRFTGGFIVIDRMTDTTVGAGMIVGARARETDVHWHDITVDRLHRAALNGHRPAVVWLTGLSGAGKSTIANEVERKLHHEGVRTYLLDGDNVRHGLNGDLGFSDADRVENIRRVSEVASLMADAGLVVICALISPFAADRDAARGRVPAGEFFEVFINVPLAVAEQRDPKSLYRKARAGELPGFTGIDSPYEAPAAPELIIDTTATAPRDAAAEIVDMLRQASVLAGFADAVIPTPIPTPGATT
jgi:bifunctional enzyme CysN/CysC